MKMYIGSTKVDRLKLHTDSDDATLKASDLQAGITAYAKGQKVTGSGKSFEFAMYGSMSSNITLPILSDINTIEISSTEYPLQQVLRFGEIRNTDFAEAKLIANATVDGSVCPITIKIVPQSYITVACSKSFSIELFLGKDNYT